MQDNSRFRLLVLAGATVTPSDIERAGIQATGNVGESDPQLAIADALQTFQADQILIVTHPQDESTWLEKEAFERAQGGFSQPITHLVVEQRNGGHTITEVE